MGLSLRNESSNQLAVSSSLLRLLFDDLVTGFRSGWSLYWAPFTTTYNIVRSAVADGVGTEGAPDSIDSGLLRDVPAESPSTLARASATTEGEVADILVVDAIDDDLFAIFREEGDELLPQLQSLMRDWVRRPSELSAATACMRTLHTFERGAKLVGAMRLGEMAHRLAAAIDQLLALGQANAADVEALLARLDAISGSFDVLRQSSKAEAPASDEALQPPAPTPHEEAPGASQQPNSLPGSFKAGGTVLLPVAGTAAVRVRAPLLDRLVNQAGEISITRSRIESGVGQIKGSLGDLTENLERLRQQLRDIEFQAETRMSSRLEAAKAAAQTFDPLEFDRFTRFQELMRMMAESVNDVATVQRTLQRSLDTTEDELDAQARLTRDLQDDLQRVRMVEFESTADRLHRIVRLAAEETGKQVRLDIIGGAIEIDRSVLERLAGPLEHLLRDTVAHGVETPEQREAAGKDRTANVTITVTQEDDVIGVDVRDDGAGLNLARIRERSIECGLITADASLTDDELAQLIVAPEFSAGSSITELAGLDVIRAEVDAMGGHLQASSLPGRGTTLNLFLPLTTAVTQVVMLRCGELSVAVPSALVELVRRVPVEEIEKAYASGNFIFGNRSMPFFWLGALLRADAHGSTTDRPQSVVVIRSAARRVALHVDEVLGHQEVVSKNLGPQLSRVPGLVAIAVLRSGMVALTYNPVALATLYGDIARERGRHLPGAGGPAASVATATQAPLVLVVDDSLTVRRVIQRLLEREGYRVTLAKDGLDALDRLVDEKPALILSDIEMPRMDGFSFLRNVRADARFADLPVIMLTSRIAEKRPVHVPSSDVDHYLRKPYSEEELLSLVGRYASIKVST